MGDAVGMLEVFGLATAFAAADAGCKAGNVWLEKFDKNKPANADKLPVPLLVTIKFRGDVAAVEAAIERAQKAVEPRGMYLDSSVIARPDKKLIEQIL